MNRKKFIQQGSMLGFLPFLNSGYNLTLTKSAEQALIAEPLLKNSYWYIGHLMSLLLSSDDTQGAFALMHGFEVKGLEPPPHTHTKEDESFYLLKGEIEYTVGGRIFPAKAGNWMFLPRNIQHSFLVITDTAEVLIHLSPGGFENYFIEMSEPAKEMVIPPKPQGPPDVKKIVETASKYGIVFAKP